MKNLYVFSKAAWHVKLFKWVYNTDPTETFKTMCPYFWSLVATFLFFPLILLAKLFGKAGTNLLNKLESYKRDKRDRAEANLVLRCSKYNLTDEEAYNIVESKCWYRYKYILEYDLYFSVIKKRDNYNGLLFNIKKIDALKQTKTFTFIGYITSISILSTLLYIMYFVLSNIEFLPVDWSLVLLVLKVTAEVTVGIGAGVILCTYIIFPFFSWLSCRECVLCKLGIGKYIVLSLRFIWKGICIVGDMIYMTYKKACPIITWKDEDTKN